MAAPLIIDITRLVGRALQRMLPTGIDRLMFAYVEHYRSTARALVCYGGRWMVFSPGDSQRVFDILLKPGINSRYRLRWYVAKAYLLGWYRGPAILCNIGHHGTEHPDYGHNALRRGWKTLFFVHDLIPLTHAEYCRPGEAQKHHTRITTMLMGTGLVMNSRDTQRIAEEYARRHALPVPPSCIAFPAPVPLPKPAAKALLDRPYFVMLGTIEARKNHLLLLQVWRALAQALGDGAPRLVIIGQRGWECEQAVDMLERCVVLRGLVIEEGRCSDDRLATWLTHARALLFPSFAEGFGLPVMEAIMMGLPVIASGLAVFKEIAGDIPEYLDPLDGPGWQRMLEEYAKPESQRRQEQCKRMKGFSVSTWDNHFAIVDHFIKEICN